MKQPTIVDDGSLGETAAPKGDRLDMIAPAVVVPVQSVKIVPSVTKPQDASKREITSWHWHEGTLAVKRR
jgi:hypothetical protein